MDGENWNWCTSNSSDNKINLSRIQQSLDLTWLESELTRLKRKSLLSIQCLLAENYKHNTFNSFSNLNQVFNSSWWLLVISSSHQSYESPALSTFPHNCRLNSFFPSDCVTFRLFATKHNFPPTNHLTSVSFINLNGFYIEISYYFILSPWFGGWKYCIS